MNQPLRERIGLQATRNYVGRTQELSRLLNVLDEQKTPVVFVHGIGGIGKSRLARSLPHKPRPLAR